MNESIKQCKYPSRWKMGQVTPLFKKDDELSKENYRPVTVLPALNNVFEKLLASQLASSILKYCLTTSQLIGDTIAVKPRQ